MNRRISKKQHKKYLPDLGIEICQDKDWQSRLAKMEIGQSIAIENSDTPVSVYSSNKTGNFRRLNFEVARVEPTSIPVNESKWWEIGEKAIFLAFYPADFKKLCWYAVIN